MCYKKQLQQLNNRYQLAQATHNLSEMESIDKEIKIVEIKQAHEETFGFGS